MGTYSLTESGMDQYIEYYKNGDLPKPVWYDDYLLMKNGAMTFDQLLKIYS